MLSLMTSSQQHSPATSSGIPKRSFPSFSVRRPSTSSVTSPSTQPRTSFSSTSNTTPVAASPTPLNYSHNTTNAGQNGSPAGSGISSFRSLRNLLPFGPPKQPSSVASNASRSPFAGFGSMRRSVTINREKERERERKISLTDDAYMPVISIERKPSHIRDDPPLRRSISLPRLEVNLDKHDGTTIGQNQGETAAVLTIPILRTPSPGPPLLAELSTIIEVDSSGISKYVPFLTPSTESSHSLSPPTSPACDDAEEHTVRRPLFLHPTTPLMTASTPLTPSTPAQPPSNPSTDKGTSVAHDADLELSTSHLVSQVKDAMARTSWTGSDKAVILDADASFLHTSSSQEEDADGDGEDDSASILAVLDTRSGSASSLPSTLEAGSDDISHMNNSLSSVINPNHLYTADDATLDLGSLDPDLRVALSHSAIHQTNTYRKCTSPSSAARSSAPALGVTLLSPPQPLQQPPSLPTSACFAPPGSTPSASTPNLAPSTKSPPPAGSISQSKRRIVSSYLPRLRPTPPRSNPSSATNSPSPHKTTFDCVPRSVSSTTSTRPPMYVQNNPRGPGTPLSAQWASSPSNSAPSSAKRQMPGSAEFGVGFAAKAVGGANERQDPQELERLPAPVITSTPMKPKAKKGLDGHTRKSSVPVASWRQKERLDETDRSREDSEEETPVLQSQVGPEVRILEASAEIHPNIPGNDSSDRWKSGKATEHELRADSWSPGPLHQQGDGSPIFGPGSYHDRERLGGDRGEGPRILGSPFHTPEGRDGGNGWLGVRGRMGNALRPGLYPSPSHSPSPSPAVAPSSLYPSPNPSAQHIGSSGSASPPTPTETMLSLNPSPCLPCQSSVPSPIIPNSSTGSENEREADEDSPVRIGDSGNLSGRPSRRAPVLSRLFWGNPGSSGEDRAERQPSPLRSVMRADRSGGDVEDGGAGDAVGLRVQVEADAKFSVDESTASGSVSVRPSIESARPSMDSCASSVSAPVSLRRSPEPRYQRHSMELARSYGPESLPSRPPTSFRERDELVPRLRKRSLSMRESNGDGVGLGVANEGNGSARYSGGTALSARERLARARQGDFGTRARPWSSLSMRNGRMEGPSDVGSRSELSASRGAGRIMRGTGLLDYERERSPVLGGIERSVSERASERERERETHYRERSGSASALLGIGTLGRYASLRSTSEYNFGGSASAVNLTMQHQAQHQSTAHARSTSRMTFSESGGSAASGHGRRGSGAFSIANSGLTDSPTFTVLTSASGSRETTRSASTGATSVSMGSLTQAGVKEREELRELKEKHSVETGALLSALSDSQRTCRVLREENGELRDKLVDMEKENEKLRRILGEVEVEVERLRFSQEREKERERERNWERERVLGRGLSASAGPGAGGRKEQVTPLAKARHSALGSRTMPLVSKWQRGYERDSERDGRYEDKILTAKHLKPEPDATFSRDTGIREQQYTLHEEELDAPTEAEDSSEDTVATASILTVNRRRLSTSSSIFPALPPNMIMLLHDETASLPDSNRSSADLFSLNGFKTSTTPSLPIHRSSKEGQVLDNSVASNVSASPTENFSLVTGSPGSLFLKPEHEVMLGEMESLDLGRGERSEVEVWSD